MNNKINMILKNNIYLKIISLIVAFIMFLFISQTGNPWWKELFTQTTLVNNVVTNVVYNNEKYYVTGLPNKMPINIQGNENNINAALKQESTFSVNIDLTDKGAGEYTIKSNDMTFNLPTGVVGSSAISEFKISIQNKSVRDFPIDINYIDGNKDLGIIFDTPTLSANVVTLTSGSETINSIANVQALVNLNDINITGSNGEANIVAKLIAYDNNGNVVENVTFSQNTINVRINYSTELVTLPIDFNFIGVTDKYVSSICPTNAQKECSLNDEIKVQVFGDNQKIKELSKTGRITYNVDLANVIENNAKVSGVAIVPNGVYIMGGNIMEFNVTLENGSSKKLENVGLRLEGLKSGLEVKAVNQKEGLIDVEITGAKSIIDQITNNDLNIYIDLSNINDPGTYELPILVKKTKPFNFKLDIQTIKIEVVGA